MAEPEKLTDRVIDPAPGAKELDDSAPLPAQGDNSVQAKDVRLQPMPQELLDDLGGQLDRIAACGITAIVSRKAPAFKLTEDEVKGIGWGKTAAKLLNWYVPQMASSSPWPAFVLASFGIGAVVFAKMRDAQPQETIVDKAIIKEQAAAPPSDVIDLQDAMPGNPPASEFY